jgi:hypothetical protein
LDLTSGYHQVEVHAESRWLTAFITHKGIYQFARLPMGKRSTLSLSKNDDFHCPCWTCICYL